MKGWRQVTIDDVCEVIAGQSPEGKYYNKEGEGLPFYQGKKEFTEKFIGAPTTWTTNITKEAKEGDILMSVRAPVGPINFASQKICIGRGLAAIRAGEDVDNEFLFYLLLAKQDDIKGQDGAVFSSINKGQIGKIELKLPPLEEQKRIVAILDEAFEGIARAEANAEKNLANARELFENSLQTIFFNKKDIWEEKQLEQLGDIQTGYTPKTSDKTNFGDFIPFIKPGDFLPDGSLNYSNQGLSETGMKQSRTIKSGSVLMVCIGATIGKVGVCDRDITTNQQINSLKPYKGVSEKFLYYQMLIPSFQQDVIHYSGQATLPIINKSKWSALKILIPQSEQEQIEIVERLDTLLEQSQRLEDIYRLKLKSLAELKQSLIEKAFSGELTADNVVAFPSAVTEPQNVEPKSPEFAADVLAFGYYWHEAQGKQKTYGHVKSQKFLQLAESIGGIDMGRQPVKDAAGPNDFQHMLGATDWARGNNFFEYAPRTDGHGYDFRKLDHYNTLIGNALEAVKPYQKKLEKVLSILLPMNSREAEVLATVHAAWNNLLLDGKEASEDAIIYEARENWTDSKRGIPESEFRQAIKTIRANGIVPDGTAKRVTGQESLSL